MPLKVAAKVGNFTSFDYLFLPKTKKSIKSSRVVLSGTKNCGEIVSDTVDVLVGQHISNGRVLSLCSQRKSIH